MLSIHEENVVGIFNGTKNVKELSQELQNKNTLNIYSTGQKNVENNIMLEHGRSSIDENPEVVKDFNSLCWSCSETQVKLYKCGGCHKARYCSEQCISNDWTEHMNYCIKVQEK